MNPANVHCVILLGRAKNLYMRTQKLIDRGPVNEKGNWIFSRLVSYLQLTIFVEISDESPLICLLKDSIGHNVLYDCLKRSSCQKINWNML